MNPVAIWIGRVHVQFIRPHQFAKPGDIGYIGDYSEYGGDFEVLLVPGRKVKVTLDYSLITGSNDKISWDRVQFTACDGYNTVPQSWEFDVCTGAGSPAPTTIICEMLQSNQRLRHISTDVVESLSINRSDSGTVSDPFPFSAEFPLGSQWTYLRRDPASGIGSTELMFGELVKVTKSSFGEIEITGTYGATRAISRREAGLILEAGPYTFGDWVPKVGDRISFRTNHHDLAFLTQDSGQILEVHDDGSVTVYAVDGESVHIDASMVHAYLVPITWTTNRPRFARKLSTMLASLKPGTEVVLTACKDHKYSGHIAKVHTVNEDYLIFKIDTCETRTVWHRTESIFAYVKYLLEDIRPESLEIYDGRRYPIPVPARFGSPPFAEVGQYWYNTDGGKAISGSMEICTLPQYGLPAFSLRPVSGSANYELVPIADFLRHFMLVGNGLPSSPVIEVESNWPGTDELYLEA